MPRSYKIKTQLINEEAMQEALTEYFKDKTVCSFAGLAKKHNSNDITFSY